MIITNAFLFDKNDIFNVEEDSEEWKKMKKVLYRVHSKNDDKIKEEFVFNSMRAKIDNLLNEAQKRRESIAAQEEKEVEAIRDSRKSWFGRNRFEQIDDSLNYDEGNSILYNDIDMSRTGFRKQEDNNK